MCFLYSPHRITFKMKKLTAISIICTLGLTACQSLIMQENRKAEALLPQLQATPIPIKKEDLFIQKSQEHKSLDAWWSFFGDSVLNDFVSSGLSMNAAKFKKENPFPQEISPKTLEAYYKEERVEFVSKIVKDYIEYRYIQKRSVLLNSQIKIYAEALSNSKRREKEHREKELRLLRDAQDEFLSQLSSLAVSLSKTTKLMPEYINEVFKRNQGVTSYDITPIMASSALIMAHTIPVSVARTMLSSQTHGGISVQKTADIFPDMMFSQFFGVPQSLFANPEQLWRIKIGQAHRNINLGEVGNSPEFKDKIHAYITEIEGILTNISTLRAQQVVLDNAVKKATQKEMYEASLSALKAEYQIAKTIMGFFKKLDIY